MSFDDDNNKRSRTRPEDMYISPMVQFVEGMETTVCESQVTFVELGDFELDREAPSIEPRGPELRVHGDYRADDKWME